MRNVDNEMTIMFLAKSENESFARVAVAAFAAQTNPTLDELTEIKTIVSEAVTNAIIHGYPEGDGYVFLHCKIMSNRLEIVVEDHGVGMRDTEEARQPLFTTRPDLDRTGMGLTIIESYVQALTIESKLGEGTRLRMVKSIAKEQSAAVYEV